MEPVLTFFDLTVLSVMEKHMGEPLSQADLIEAVNNRLQRQGVPVPAYTIRAYKPDQIMEAQRRLTSTGYITRLRARKSADINEKGLALLVKLPDNWREWPVELPIRNGRPDWDHANYLARNVRVRV